MDTHTHTQHSHENHPKKHFGWYEEHGRNHLSSCKFTGGNLREGSSLAGGRSHCARPAYDVTTRVISIGPLHGHSERTSVKFRSTKLTSTAEQADEHRQARYLPFPFGIPLSQTGPPGITPGLIGIYGIHGVFGYYTLIPLGPLVHQDFATTHPRLN